MSYSRENRNICEETGEGSTWRRTHREFELNEGLGGVRKHGGASMSGGYMASRSKQKGGSEASSASKPRKGGDVIHFFLSCCRISSSSLSFSEVSF